MLDLDRFKEVNDLFGHLVGDELLQQVAARLNARLRGIDTVCRLGGDEFVILLENITQTNAAAVVATDIVVSLREPYELAQDIKVSISASIGISLYPDHGNKPEQLLQHADSALYHAKSEGKNRFKYFSERFHDDSKNQTDIENRLRYGIEQSQLRLFYQPQINIKTGDIIGAEALLRWQDPINGLILPKSFIHLAEKTGLITTIGNWVLKEACMQGRHWLDTGLSSFTLSVNISLHQFRYGHLDQLISSILTETGFPANRLVIELTESALMLRETEALQILERLHALGVILAIDNFGMGYSSLSYLQRFPVQQLKIDKCFIARLAEQQRDSMITSTIIALAHALDFKVLAEGVETNAQLEFLQMHGCDLYQGYLASPPLPADEFTELLRNQLKMSDSH